MGLSKEDLEAILEALSSVYESAGKKIQTATLVEDIDEDGNIVGENLIDNREDKELN